MRALGIDFGTKRIGVAISDDGGLVATPYSMIRRVGDRIVEHGRIAELVEETGAEIVVVGLPISLDGDEGRAAALVRSEVRGLSKRLPVPVETIDERFSTVTAHRRLADAGIATRKRGELVDAVAASVFLQAWLDRR
jgi:putative Holliday junction resolvase